MRRLLLSLLAVAALSAAAAAADKPFVVTWYGQAFFTVATPSGKVIAFDPQIMDEFSRLDGKIKADFVCVSHLHNDHNRVEDSIAEADDAKKVKVFQGMVQDKPTRPGEWVKVDEKVKVGDKTIRFRTVGNYHDNMSGLKRGKNSAFLVEVDGLTFCHLGDLGHELTEQEVKAYGKIDVLFVPVGGIYTLNGEEAKNVTAALKPRLYAIPMHYGVPGYQDLQPPDEFLDGQKNLKQAEATNELTIPADMKAGETYTVMQLNWKKADKK